MPIYEFEDIKSGQIVELLQHVSEHVEIGKTIRHEGRTLRRIPSTPEFLQEPDWSHTGYAFDEEDAKLAPRVDENGYPVFRNRAEILKFESAMDKRNEEFAKRTGTKVKEKFRYDFGRFRRQADRPQRAGRNGAGRRQGKRRSKAAS